jgi:hypothetical protein
VDTEGLFNQYDSTGQGLTLDDVNRLMMPQASDFKKLNESRMGRDRGEPLSEQTVDLIKYLLDTHLWV